MFGNNRSSVYKVGISVAIAIMGTSAVRADRVYGFWYI